MDERSAGAPMRMTADAAVKTAAPGLFDELPHGHFWLEHLARTLARQAQPGDVMPWRFAGVPREDGATSALYAVNVETGYAMLHSVDPRAPRRRFSGGPCGTNRRKRCSRRTCCSSGPSSLRNCGTPSTVTTASSV